LGRGPSDAEVRGQKSEVGGRKSEGRRKVKEKKEKRNLKLGFFIRRNCSGRGTGLTVLMIFVEKVS
jgi:hypothetical protein